MALNKYLDGNKDWMGYEEGKKQYQKCGGKRIKEKKIEKEEIKEVIRKKIEEKIKKKIKKRIERERRERKTNEKKIK